MVGKIREDVCVILSQRTYFPRLCSYWGLWFGRNGVFSCENIFSWTRLSIFALFSQVYLKKMPAYNLNKTELSLWKSSYLVGNTARLLFQKGIFNFGLVVWLLYVVFYFCFRFRYCLVWYWVQSIPGLDILGIMSGFSIQSDCPFFLFFHACHRFLLTSCKDHSLTN